MLLRFLKDALVYGAFHILVRFASFFLLPLYTRVLTPQDYGTVDVLLAYQAFLLVTASLEISQALARYYPGETREGRVECASTAYTFTALTLGSVALAAELARAPVAELILGSASSYPLVRLMLWGAFAQALYSLVLLELGWGGRSAACAIATAVGSLGTVVATVGLVLVLRRGAVGIVEGQLAGASFGYLVGLILGAGRILPGFRTARLRSMLAFAIPLVASSIAVVLSLQVQRVVLKECMSLQEVGLYGVAFRIASIASVFPIILQSAVTPLVMRRISEPGTPAEVARLFRLTCAAALLMFAGMALFARELTGLLAAPPFQAAWIYVAPVVATTLLSALYVFAPGMAIAGKTWRMTLVNGVGAALNAGLTLLLVPVAGISGAVGGAFAAAAVVFALQLHQSQRFYPVPHAGWRLGGATLAILGVAGAGLLVRGFGTADWAWRAALLATCPVLLLGFGLVKRAELAAGLRFFRPKSDPT